MNDNVTTHVFHLFSGDRIENRSVIVASNQNQYQISFVCNYKDKKRNKILADIKRSPK